MSSKLLVGNVPIEAGEDGLKEFFSQFGRVKSVTLPKNDSGRAKGFAFVEMTSRGEALTALNGLSNAQFAGRKLTVTLGEKDSVPSAGIFSWLKLFKA